MEKQHEKMLAYFEKDLEKTLKLFYLLPKLVDRKLVTAEEEALLNDPDKSDSKKNIEFLSILKTKGSRAFGRFLEALNEEKEHCGHEDMYDKLLNASSKVDHLSTYGSDQSSRHSFGFEDDTISSRSPTSETMSHVTSGASRSNSSLETMVNDNSDFFVEFKSSVENSLKSIQAQLTDLQTTVKRLENDVHHLQNRSDYSSTLEPRTSSQSRDYQSVSKKSHTVDHSTSTAGSSEVKGSSWGAIKSNASSNLVEDYKIKVCSYPYVQYDVILLAM